MARATTSWGISGLLAAVAIVIFVLAAFGVDVGDFDRLDMISLGLAFFAGAHLA